MTTERNVKGLLGTKLGMTQLWDDNNKVVPVTVIAATTNIITQVRLPEPDGYNAIQVGYGEIEGRKITKPQAGHFDKAGTTPRRHLVELRTSDAGEYTVGQEITATVFEPGAVVDVVVAASGSNRRWRPRRARTADWRGNLRVLAAFTPC